MAKFLNKKVLPIIMAVLVFVLAVGGVVTAVLLSKKSPDPAPESNPSSQGEEEEPVGATVNVKVWHTFTGNAKTIFEKDIVAAFKQQNKNIRIMPVKMDCSLESVKSAVASGQGPDMIIVPAASLSDFAEENIIQNLVGKRNFDTIKAAQFNQLYNLVKVNNGYYGIPVNALVDVAVYNESALGGAAAPKTLEELAALNKTIGINGYNTESLLSLFYSAGGAVMKDDFSTAVGYMDSNASVKALQSLVSLKKLYADFSREGAPSPMAGVASGDYLMTVANSKAFSNEGVSTDGLTAALVPTANGAASKSVAGCDAAAILESSAMKDEAWQFIQFLAGDEAQAVMAKSGDLPANDAAARLETTKESVPFADVYLEALEGAQLRVVDKKHNAVMPYIDKAFADAITGAKKPGDALTLCAKQIDAVLQGKQLPLDSAGATLEAETGRLTGTAVVVDNGNASGGKYVSGLNWEAGEPNRLIFDNLKLEKKGTYELRIGYSSGTNGGVAVLVNGVKLACQYTYTDLGWAFVPNVVTMEIPLKGDGTDTLEFFDIQAGCYIWIDYIQLSYLNGNYEEPEDIDKPVEDGRIEAESGELIGKAEVCQSFLASGGKYVVGLNADVTDPLHPTFPNRVRFDASLLKVDKAGTYEVTMGYSAGVAGILGANINGKEKLFPFERSTPADNDWSYVPATFTFKIELKGDGTDVIEFYDVSNFIWMDYFRLSYLGGGAEPDEGDGRIEAETGEMSGEAFVFTQAGASESRVVTGLDATEGNLNKVTFKDLPTQGRGTYTLKMVYSSATNGILLAIVNGVPMEMPWTFTDTTWAYVPNTLTLDIPLRGDGTDTIAFTIKNSGEYIWLDYFYLTFKSSEIVKPEGMVEAEIGHLGGSAEIKSNNVASEGKYVTGLHSAAGNPNFVSLSGSQLVKEAGVYDMSIAYSAAQSGVLGVELNGVTYEVPYGFTDVDGAFSLSAATLWRVPFKGDGTDIVKFYDIEGSISLDYIQLTRKGDTPPAYLYEGEKAEMHGEAAAMPKPQGENPNEAFSGGGYAYNFNFDKPGSFVRFKNLGVTAENAGRYKVTATLMALVNGNIGVRVNGYEVIAPFTFDAEKPWIPNVTVEVEVALRGGDDDYIDIFVPDANTNWFWLDCIKIEYIGEDVSDLRTDRLEAEDAEYDEAIVPKREESNGAFTITLPADGVVSFRDVMTSAIDKAGVYTMNIVYRTAVENARLQATVSHEEENPDGTIVLLDLLKSEGLTMVSKNVTLQGDGSDCIEIQALGGEIAIDYITFTYFGEIIPGLTLEAEDATVDDACIVTDDAASNRQAVTGLQDGKTLTYKNIIVPASGVYNLILQYKAEEAGQAQIVVNGRAAQTLSYEAGESFAQSAALAVPLKGDGTDTIVIADAESGKSFVLDYAVLQYVKPIVSSNKTLTVDYAKPYGSATIAAGKAENLTSLDSEGVNFDENKMYKPGGDSYIAFEDLAIYKPGWYNLRLDAGYNAYATRMIVTVNAGAADEKTSGYVINTDGYTEPMLVYLRGDGTDSIRIEELTGGTWSYGFVRGIVLSPADVAYFSEAEEADEVHGVIHGYAENDGFYRPCKSSGLAYVDSFHTSTGEGVIFKRVNVAEAGEYILNIRAFNGGDAMLDVVVNGTTYKVSFNTGDWETFTTRQVNIPLQAGDNTIQIKYGDGATYAAIDYISVTSGSIIEFETANTAGSIVSATSGGAAGCDGASGGQVFNNIGTGTVTIALPTDLVQNGHYRLNFGVVPVFLIDIAGTVNDETFTVKLSGFPTQSFSKPSGFAVENITLKGDGTDTIVLTLNDNWAHLDYVYLQYMGDEAPLL